ncbi:hypothetical protein BDV96DRAFT_243083 [Lophiotrema nucula]|uniref:Uncharacterized protein n=1 Tax=Lophiotrema nucula TaxID=690887 RepID=A0A6A5YR97_9PLEO|nr:hypothetical protein BDV96DRAFT_243083 [Lophiotrema nucula]
MEFPNDLSKLPADKAIRICVSASIEVLNQIYSGRFPTGPINHTAMNLVGIEFVRDVYSHIFRPVNLDEAANMIRVCNYIGRDKYSEAKPEPLDDKDIVWHTWFAVFDHLVPPEDSDPEVLQLHWLENAEVVRGRSRSDRPRVNAEVQREKDLQLEIKRRCNASKQVLIKCCKYF